MPQMQVWLPVKTTPISQTTGFTNFPDEQLEAVIEQYLVVHKDLICPGPLGHRETFLWQLQADLSKSSGDRPALADLFVLLEGALYGLLRTRTYDLRRHNFLLDEDDRHLTVLTYRSTPGAPESVAGFFSPYTLVCPAANWTSRKELTQRVQQLRDSHAGNNARALLRAFHDQFRNVQMPWVRAITSLLAAYPATALDPSEANQSNVGPFLLQTAPGATPETVFLPSYSLDRLSRVLHHLQGTHYQPFEHGVAVLHNSQTLAKIALPAADRPKLFGLGAIELTATAELPAQSTFSNETKDQFKKALAAVVNAYQSEIVHPEPRFLLPDVLRAVFCGMGRPAAVAFLTGEGTRWLYSDAIVQASFDVLPHQTKLVSNALQPTAEGAYFADQLPGGRISIYIEHWCGRQFGELTRLGSALWRVFRVGRSKSPQNGGLEQMISQLFRNNSGRLNTEMPPQPPELQDAISWSDFLYWLEQQPSPLFRAAASEFAAAHRLPDVVARRRSNATGVIKIGHHDWRVPQ